MDVTQEVANHINPKKAPGVDKMYPGRLKELQKSGCNANIFV